MQKRNARRIAPQIIAIFLLLPTFSSYAATNPSTETVQRLLIDLGYEPGEPDGQNGTRTRSAVAVFQQDFDLPENGNSNAATLKQLETAHRKMLKRRGETADEIDYVWLIAPQSANATTTNKGQRTESYSDGFGDEPEREFSLLAVTQEQLDELGYDPGNFEGDFSAETRAALIAFQKKQGIPLTGKPDNATNRALNKAMVQVKRDQIEEQKAAGKE